MYPTICGKMTHFSPERNIVVLTLIQLYVVIFRVWQFLRSNIDRPGVVLVTSPSLEQSLCHLQVSENTLEVSDVTHSQFSWLINHPF